jgi:catechol 2,3-dioxygenase-like lactoylglutathione lyase family enzyme
MRSRARAITPLLVVSDLKRSIDFYCEKLGFVDPRVWGEPPCFAMLNRDGFELMLSLAESPERVKPHGPQGTWDFYLRVTDVAAEAEALRSAGGVLDKGPTDMFYEMREIECLDPDGHRICLAQDLSGSAVAAEEAWAGVLDLGPSKLRLVLRLSRSGESWVGQVDSLDQGAMNLPVDSVTREGGSVRFEMKAISAGFEGSLGDDGRTLAGRWTQRDHTWPLVFRRS